MNSIIFDIDDIITENDAMLDSYLSSVRLTKTDMDYISELNDEYLMHYGVGPDDDPPGRGSGRYAKGSGENPYQHGGGLKGEVARLKKQGKSMSEIAETLGYVNRQGKPSTYDLRAAISIESNRQKADLAMKVPEYKATGMSNTAIAEKLGISEASVRNYLDKDRQLQFDKTTRVAEMLKEELKTKHYLDVGKGVELDLLENGVSKERLKTAVTMLEQEGYKLHKVPIEQMGNPGKYTTMLVLGEPNTEWKKVVNNPQLIKTVQSYAVNNGETIQGLQPVKSIKSSRVYINYTNEDGTGGAEKDGLIELRRGVPDLSLVNSRYAQVRIGVDGTHYMKGMAVYSDDVPDGYDVIYNTNKKVGTPPGDVFKKMKTIKQKDGTEVINQENPFGATIKPLKAGGQHYYIDENGKEQLSAINKVNEQGDWDKWSRTISPQMLSKQPLPLIKRQLELTYQDRKTEYAEISALTNPTVKRKLLESFADDCDAAASHLKAKAFPGQATHAIIPITSLKGDDNYRREHGVDGEIYARNYEHGSTVALVRFPHAGTFEIPILRVNNKNPEALKILGNAPDAVGINSHIAERLSGADFDGDTVVVIPTDKSNIKSTPRLRSLIGFDTKQYKFADPDAPTIKSQTKQTEMGKITNLIADMQIRGAGGDNPVTEDEIARAVKHSMVVIDSEKHHLDYKKSEMDNGIKELKKKYQGGVNKGASTLVTRANAGVRQDVEKPVSVEDEETGKKYYGIDPNTGKRATVKTGEVYTKTWETKKGEVRSKEVVRQEKVKGMDTADDARKLMSSMTNPHPIELAYADYANGLKTLANEARKELTRTPRLKRDPAAAKEYATEVKELEAKLKIALRNAPRERQAQAISRARYNAIIKENPEIKEDKDHLKRLRGQLLDSARRSVNAKKEPVKITEREWEAIQKGAISDSMLLSILDNGDADQIRKYATPRNNKGLSDAKMALARSWYNTGYSQQEIANRLGVSKSTIANLLR